MDGIKEHENKVLISTGRLCKLLEIDDKTLTNWKRKGLKQHKRGWWDLQLVLKWIGLIYNDDTEDSKALSLQQKKLEAEIAFKEAQSELNRLKVDIANGRYLEKQLVETELSRFFLVFKKSAMTLSRTLAGEVGNYVEPLEARRIEKRLTDTITDALQQMSVDGVFDAKKTKI